MDRRQFISMISTLLVSYPADTLLADRASNTASPATKLDEPWHTLTAVLEHLFPAGDNTPGANDIRALEFIRTMLKAPDADNDEAEFITNGTGWLNDLAIQKYSHRFAELNEIDRESVLRQIEQSRAGERWLSLLLTYLLEALLSDPVYGGNPQGIGWQWLEHQPGFPRPSADKAYYRLGIPRFTRTKA